MSKRRLQLIRRFADKVARTPPLSLLKRDGTWKSSHKRGRRERLKGPITLETREQSFIYLFRDAVEVQ
jgi:hypothetical protein